MNFSFELSWAVLTGNVNPNAMMGMSTLAGLLFGWMAMVRIAVMLAVAVFMIISRWKVLTKAGLPGWGIFVPVYNWILILKLWGISWRWVVSILLGMIFWMNGMVHQDQAIRAILWGLSMAIFGITMIVNYFKIAQKFWKHWTYGFGLRFLKIIFIPILAFDNSKYLGKQATKTIAKPSIVVAKPVVAKTTATKAPVKKVWKRTAPVKKAAPKEVKKVTKKK